MDNNMSGHGQGCMCPNCGGNHAMMGFGHKYFLIRLLLGLIILSMVFWIGMQIGEFKGAFERSDYSYSRHMMMSPMMMHHNMMYKMDDSGMMQVDTSSGTTKKAQ